MKNREDVERRRKKNNKERKQSWTAVHRRGIREKIKRKKKERKKDKGEKRENY
jgi:hypothetical protein